MSQHIKQIATLITPADLTHGGLGFIAVINGLWLDYLNPFAQILVTVGGLFYLYYMIRNKRAEWKQRQRDLEDGTG